MLIISSHIETVKPNDDEKRISQSVPPEQDLLEKTTLLFDSCLETIGKYVALDKDTQRSKNNESFSGQPIIPPPTGSINTASEDKIPKKVTDSNTSNSARVNQNHNDALSQKHFEISEDEALKKLATLANIVNFSVNENPVILSAILKKSNLKNLYSILFELYDPSIPEKEDQKLAGFNQIVEKIHIAAATANSELYKTILKNLLTKKVNPRLKALKENFHYTTKSSTLKSDLEYASLNKKRFLETNYPNGLSTLTQYIEFEETYEKTGIAQLTQKKLTQLEELAKKTIAALEQLTIVFYCDFDTDSIRNSILTIHDLTKNMTTIFLEDKDKDQNYAQEIVLSWMLFTFGKIAKDNKSFRHSLAVLDKILEKNLDNPGLFFNILINFHSVYQFSKLRTEDLKQELSDAISNYIGQRFVVLSQNIEAIPTKKEQASNDDLTKIQYPKLSALIEEIKQREHLYSVCKAHLIFLSNQFKSDFPNIKVDTLASGIIDITSVKKLIKIQNTAASQPKSDNDVSSSQQKAESDNNAPSQQTGKDDSKNFHVSADEPSAKLITEIDVLSTWCKQLMEKQTHPDLKQILTDNQIMIVKSSCFPESRTFVRTIKEIVSNFKKAANEFSSGKFKTATSTFFSKPKSVSAGKKLAEKIEKIISPTVAR